MVIRGLITEGKPQQINQGLPCTRTYLPTWKLLSPGQAIFSVRASDTDASLLRAGGLVRSFVGCVARLSQALISDS